MVSIHQIPTQVSTGTGKSLQCETLQFVICVCFAKTSRKPNVLCAQKRSKRVAMIFYAKICRQCSYLLLIIIGTVVLFYFIVL